MKEETSYPIVVRGGRRIRLLSRSSKDFVDHWTVPRTANRLRVIRYHP